MNLSLQSIYNGAATTIRSVVRLCIVIGVLFSVLNLYFHFSTPKEKQITFEQAAKMAQERNVSTIKQGLAIQDKDTQLSSQIYATVLCQIIGEACGKNLESTEETFNNSFVGKAAHLALFPLKNPPSSSAYVAIKTIEKAGFIPEAYAAEPISNARGLGFGSIEFISKLWLGLRNLAYVVIALIMISIGFMIMFRMKLGSQTVIAIENSIPKIIFALIAITFSFAISGLLIDLMYISIIIISGVFGAMSIPDFSAKEIIEKYMFAGPDDVIGFIFNDGLAAFWTLPGAIMDSLGELVRVVLHLIGGILAWYFVISKLAGYVSTLLKTDINATVSAGVVFAEMSGEIGFPDLIKQLLKGSVNTILAVSLGVLLSVVAARVILGLIVLFTGLQLGGKIFVMLLSAYIRILILIIFAPLLLLLEAIPGKNMFSSWLSTLFAEIATFPITITLFLVGALLIKSAFISDICSGRILPTNDACTVGAFPFLWGFDGHSFAIIIAFGFLFLTPTYVASLKKAINPHAMDLAPNAGIGMFFASAVGAGKTAFGGFGKVLRAGTNDVIAQKIVEFLPEALRKRADEALIKTGRNR